MPLQPLARIDQPADRAQTHDLLEMSIKEHGTALLPVQSRALYHALNLVAEAPVEQRTITSLITQVQDQAVRNGLNPFSLSGPLGAFLDADRDVLLDSDFVTFELGTLMSMGPKVTIPVLTYLFHRIEQRLDGRPTIIVIDEAWAVLASSTFGPRLELWLREFRKKNAAVVLATQSLSEIANSPQRDVILESCQTKVYLPNAEARNPQTRETYKNFGLSERLIDLIAESIPKRDYLYVSPLGKRVFQLGLGPVTLAFMGVGDKNALFEVRQIIAEHCDRWPVAWLERRGLSDWASYLASALSDNAAPTPSASAPWRTQGTPAISPWANGSHSGSPAISG